MRPPGKVLNRADHSLPRRHYDKVVAGGGLLGLACAFYLRRALPEETLLIAEASGVPSETGATHISPALVHSLFEDQGMRRRAVWAARVLRSLEAETGASQGAGFRAVGWARLEKEAPSPPRPSLASPPIATPPIATPPIATPPVESLPVERLSLDAWLAARSAAERGNLERLLTLAEISGVRYDPGGGYVSAEAAALAFGRGAVRLGADLLIGGRATPLGGGELSLERLEFTRALTLAVRRRERVSAGAVVIAAGAETATLVRAAGSRLLWRRRYSQFPRLEASARLVLEGGRVALPVVEYLGFGLRPQGEGLLVVPPALPPDPEGYEPRGGVLAGVPVGLRQELVDALLERLEHFSFLGWETMNLGKTPRAVRGAWEAVTRSGLPEAAELAPGFYALAGGREGVTLGLAQARDLAGQLAGEEGRPWNA